MGSSFPSFYYFFCFAPSLPYTIVLFLLLGDFISYLSGGNGYLVSADVVVVGALFVVMFVISFLHTIIVYLVYRAIDKNYNLDSF